MKILKLISITFLLQLLIMPNVLCQENETGTFTDERDGQEYKWVKIGDQIWMAENLAYDAGKGSWAYKKDESNVDTYGRLYNYKTAKKVCPIGWHLPSEEEWDELAKHISNKKGPYKYSKPSSPVNAVYAGKWTEIAKHLKAEIGWQDDISNCIDDFGFSALPAGQRSEFWIFNDLGEKAYWWTANNGRMRYMWTESNDLKIWWISKPRECYSVRCVKDEN